MRITKKQAEEQERQEDLAKLREWLKPGDTLYTIVRHRAASGMSRHIGLVIIGDGKLRSPILHPNVLVGRVLGLRMNKNGDALVVGGCGMDMGFHVVSNLSARMFPEGFGCVGRGCPSNDHSNGDRNYTPHGAEVSRMLSCKRKVCTCHDPGAWKHPESYPQGCSQCGCKRQGTVEHWHKSGDYAIRQEWL